MTFEHSEEWDEARSRSERAARLAIQSTPEWQEHERKVAEDDERKALERMEVLAGRVGLRGYGKAFAALAYGNRAEREKGGAVIVTALKGKAEREKRERRGHVRPRR